MNRKRRLALALACLLLCALLPLGSRAATGGTGESLYRYHRELLPGFTYENEITQKASGGRVETFAFTLAPEAAVRPMAVSTAPIMGNRTLEEVILQEENAGRTVLAGMNADFFSGYRVPLGIVIEDGLLRTSPAAEGLLAFTPEGCFTLPESGLTMTMTWEDEAALVVHHLNKRLNSLGGLYLYTPDFADPETGLTLPEAWAVRFQVEEGELRIGETLSLRVTEVVEEVTEPVLLAEGELLLASSTLAFSDSWTLFTPEEPLTLTLAAEDERLNAAYTATGCGDLLVEEGQVTDPETWDRDLLATHPRTVFGVMPDGTMLFLCIDGRVSGHSVGATLAETAAELVARGCQWAVNLDGGGSTSLAVRLPGDARAQVVNTPSGGKARACGTYLLLVNEEPHQEAVGLFLEEDGQFVLTGASLPLHWLGYRDTLGALEPPEDVLVAEPTLGTWSEERYTAGETPGEEVLTLTSESLGVSGQGSLFLVEEADSMKVVDTLSGQRPVFTGLEEGAEMLLVPVLGLRGRRVVYAPEQVSFTLPEELGTVSPEGFLAITGKPGAAGELTVSLAGLTNAYWVTVASEFDDVTDHWAQGYIETLGREGIVSGTGERTFTPQANIRRGDFILMLWRSLGRGEAEAPLTFTDVAEEDYFAAALAWAQEQGIARGYTDGTFRPRDTLTREQAFTLLHRALFPEALAAGEAPLEAFGDAAEVAEYALEAISALVERGIVNGDSGFLRPKREITRAEMAKLLCVSLYPAVPLEEAEF